MAKEGLDRTGCAQGDAEQRITAGFEHRLFCERLGGRVGILIRMHNRNEAIGPRILVGEREKACAQAAQEAAIGTPTSATRHARWGQRNGNIDKDEPTTWCWMRA